MHFNCFVKGVSAQAAELKCCVGCDLPTWKGMRVLRAAFTVDFRLGVSCVLFFSNVYNILTVARTPSTLQMERCSGGRQRQQKWPLAPLPPGCLPVFSILQRLWHMGTFKAQNVLQFIPLLPHKGDLQERRALEALHTLANVLPAVRRSPTLSQ